jgi:predicted Zn-dependent protease with MMP-like domain
MSKGDKRRPGTGYAEGFDRIFRRPPEKLTLETLRKVSSQLMENAAPSGDVLCFVSEESLKTHFGLSDDDVKEIVENNRDKTKF